MEENKINSNQISPKKTEAEWAQEKTELEKEIQKT